MIDSSSHTNIGHNLFTTNSPRYSQGAAALYWYPSPSCCWIFAAPSRFDHNVCDQCICCLKLHMHCPPVKKRRRSKNLTRLTDTGLEFTKVDSESCRRWVLFFVRCRFRVFSSVRRNWPLLDYGRLEFQSHYHSGYLCPNTWSLSSVSYPAVHLPSGVQGMDTSW